MTEIPDWCGCHEQPKREPSEWALVRGVRVYNYALIDEVHHGIQADEWERRIAVAIEDAYVEGVRRGRQSIEEQLGA